MNVDTSKKYQFYGKELILEKKDYISNIENLGNALNYLYMADMDYIIAKKLYGDPIFNFGFLNHTQQAIEKYCSFLQQVFYKNTVRGHKFNQYSFLENISREKYNRLKILFDDFQKIRYGMLSFTFNVKDINNILDEFVYEFWLLLDSTNILIFSFVQGMGNFRWQKRGPFVIPYIYYYRNYFNPNYEKKSNEYLVYIEKNNIYGEQLKIIMDKLKKQYLNDNQHKSNLDLPIQN